jgi:hypothetical protein
MGRGEGFKEETLDIEEWKQAYDDLRSTTAPEPGTPIPAGHICVGADLIGSSRVGLKAIGEALYKITYNPSIHTWLPFAQVNGDEIWGIVSDPISLLELIRLLVLEDGRFRVGVGLGFVEVNSGLFPRDMGFKTGYMALNKRAKKTGKVEVASPLGKRDLAHNMREEINALVKAWKDGQSPDSASAIQAIDRAIRACEAIHS